ncbi:hypothetical protein LguiB_013802 [Lonicera macranthoides]
MTSPGFCVARTKNIMGSAKEGGSGSSIQELSLVDVLIGEVSILVLSADSSTLVVTNLLSQVCVLLVHKF